MREIEVKIKVEDFEEIEKTLNGFKWDLVSDWIFEDNLVFDYDNLSLKKSGKLLRLRGEGERFILTFKSKVRKKDGLFKEREETEVIVDDFKRMRLILENMGMKVFFRYQKYRKTYSLSFNHICLDKTPIGNFIEIEGSKEFIETYAKRLGFSPSDFINKSYYDLFSESEFSGTNEFMIF